MKKIVVVLMVCVLGMMSCKRDYLNVKNGSYVRLYHDETHQIDAEAESIITYSSNDNYHAEVNAQGLVTANYVGKANVTLTNENGDVANVEIDVIPVSNMFPEPNISLGESENSILSKYGVPDFVDEDYYFYADYSAKAPYLLVMFENEKVVAYSVLVDTDSSDIEELVTYVDERYKYIESDEDYLYYINALSISEATMAVGVGFTIFDNDVYAMLAYISTNAYKSTSGLDEMMTIFKKYISSL